MRSGEERKIVERVFRLGERPITAVMTPRVDLEWLDVTRPLDDLRAQVTASNHNWFPVASERVDAIKGVVRACASFSIFYKRLLGVPLEIEGRAPSWPPYRCQPYGSIETLAPRKACGRFENHEVESWPTGQPKAMFCVLFERTCPVDFSVKDCRGWRPENTLYVQEASGRREERGRVLRFWR